MSGGTLLALAANEIVLGEFSVLGPIDPQIAGLPAASIVKARDSKPVEAVFEDVTPDVTLPCPLGALEPASVLPVPHQTLGTSFLLLGGGRG